MAIASVAVLAGGGALIGFLLSVLGAGGSILLLPLLVSGAGLPTRDAVPLSLLVVMGLALFNLGPCLRRRQIAPRPALILGLPALVGSWIGGSWVKAGLIPEPLQLALFAAAALLASGLLVRRRSAAAAGPRSLGATNAATGASGNSPRLGQSAPWPCVTTWLLAGQGLLVGLLTGIAGVGGGFAIVPALVLLAGLPFPRASGTSLLLLALNALVALLALGHWPAAGLVLLSPLLLGGLLGAALGQRLGPRLEEQRLRQGFAALLLGSALLSGAEALSRPPALRPGASPDPAAVRPGRAAAEQGALTTIDRPACAASRRHCEAAAVSLQP